MSFIGDWKTFKPLAEALQEKFNIDAVDLFNTWKKDQLKMATKTEQNFVPAPGELENAFTKTDEYKGLQKKYSKEIKDVINTPYLARTENDVGANVSAVTKNPESNVNAALPNKASPTKEGEKRMAEDQAAIEAQRKALEDKRARDRRQQAREAEHTNK